MERRSSLTGIEIKAVVDYLSQITGSYLKNFYHVGEFFTMSFSQGIGSRKELIILPGKSIFLTDRRIEKPEVPSKLAMAVRRRIKGSRLIEVSQIGMERVVSLLFSSEKGKFSVNIEVFGRGNLVLTNENGVIELASSYRKFRDREIERGKPYLVPRSTFDLDNIEQREIEVWKALTSLGIGSPYMNEVLRNAGLDPMRKLSEMSQEEISSLKKEILNLYNAVRNPTPVIYMRDGNYIDFSFIKLNYMKNNYKEFDDVMRMLEEYFWGFLEEKGGEKGEESLERVRNRYLEEARRMREIGDFIFSNIPALDLILERVRKGYDDQAILKIDRSRRSVVISLKNMEIELDYMLNAVKNAQKYYEIGKKLERKAEGIERIKEEKEEEKEVLAYRKKWYDDFRWFISSDGLMVLAGRDKNTNRILVNKYMEDDDLFFHVDMPGGAVVVVKCHGKSAGDATIEEAAVFAACFSRAWREKLSSADVYYVRGEQVKRHPPPGIFIPKGSFFIEGRRKYKKVDLRLSIGIIRHEDELRLISSPPSASWRMIAHLNIRPGNITKEKAIQVIKKKLERRMEGMNLSLDAREIMRAMPPGNVEIEG
jgi:predicted ribosome quality control (RQC) complex YloA/Tae2 family protein